MKTAATKATTQGIPASATSTADNLLTADEFAERYGCSPRTVQRWCRDGILKPVRIGRLVRIPESQLYAVEGRAQ
jgi:excisionase family DNA binding protein